MMQHREQRNQNAVPIRFTATCKPPPTTGVCFREHLNERPGGTNFVGEVPELVSHLAITVQDGTTCTAKKWITTQLHVGHLPASSHPLLEKPRTQPEKRIMDLKYTSAAFVVSIALIGCEPTYENDRDMNGTNHPSGVPSTPATNNIPNTNTPPSTAPPAAQP
jgi:hypothetical protein